MLDFIVQLKEQSLHAYTDILMARVKDLKKIFDREW